MGRKIEENHKIITEAADTSPAEELIVAQTGEPEQYSFGDEAAEPDQAEPGKEPEKEPETTKPEEKEPEPEVSENTIPKIAEPGKEPEAEKRYMVVLVGAASYSGCGLRFTKNVPTPVKDLEVAKKLISTGLFIGN